MLKIVLVAHLTYENQWDKWHTKIQTFVFLGHPHVASDPPTQPNPGTIFSKIFTDIKKCSKCSSAQVDPPDIPNPKPGFLTKYSIVLKKISKRNLIH